MKHIRIFPLIVVVSLLLGGLVGISFLNPSSLPTAGGGVLQSGQGGGGGPVPVPGEAPLSAAQYEQIQAELAANTARLTAEGKLPPINPKAGVLFQWPVRLTASVTDQFGAGFAVTNFVDQNPGFPNQILDYNGGNRTYDTADGYNHQGIDIIGLPFSQLKMANNQLEVIAAAPGVIIEKKDGNPDQNCDFSNPNANSIYIRHADGSVAWYLHFKKGTLTSKNVGDAVAAGEYLAVVGSSGNSTGPHLHFEVYDANNKLIDPSVGPSNPTTPDSWWSNQRSYYDSGVAKLTTGNAAPEYPPCPALEIPNEASVFNPGDQIYFTAYYREAQAGTSSTSTIYRPDGSVFKTWNTNIQNYGVAAYWWNYYTIGTNEPSGVWRYEVNYNGVAQSRNFGVGISSISTFADVPATHPQYKYIQALYDAKLTSGCSTNPLMFCPDNILDRAQSAKFMVVAQLGSSFVPPPAPWLSFVLDNWVGYEWAQAWAEAMYQAKLTTGCQASPLMYCPEQKLSRVQASIFGLKMKYSVAYVPPAATGTIFADYPATDPSYSWGIAWAEQAYADGLLPACGTDPVSSKPMFCPNELVNRGWAAYLIVKAKNIPTP